MNGDWASGSATAVGTFTLSDALFPICPLVPKPQHTSIPVLLRAHACTDPSLTWRKAPEALTCLGASLETLDPSPSSPNPPLPQHHRLLSRASRAHVW